MKPLTATQITRCEHGNHKRCRCRCAGALHGAGRSQMPEYFEQVKPDDPHWLKPRSRQLPLPAPVGV